MRALYDFIVTVEDRYNNKTDVEGNELILNTEISERDHIFVNRIGTVIGVPSETPTDIQVGDQVLVHHNVFRRWYDQRGQEKNCRAFLFGDAYTVQPDQIFGYWRGGSFRNLPPYTFIKPIESTELWETSLEQGGRGVVEYSSQFERGTVVGYKPEMNVEVDIDGIKYYRILNKFINVEFEEENRKADRVV